MAGLLFIPWPNAEAGQGERFIPTRDLTRMNLPLLAWCHQIHTYQRSNQDESAIVSLVSSNSYLPEINLDESTIVSLVSSNSYLPEI